MRVEVSRRDLALTNSTFGGGELVDVDDRVVDTGRFMKSRALGIVMIVV